MDAGIYENMTYDDYFAIDAMNHTWLAVAWFADH